MLKLKTMQKRSRGFKSKNVFLALGHVEKLSCWLHLRDAKSPHTGQSGKKNSYEFLYERSLPYIVWSPQLLVCILVYQSKCMNG